MELENTNLTPDLTTGSNTLPTGQEQNTPVSNTADISTPPPPEGQEQTKISSEGTIVEQTQKVEGQAQKPATIEDAFKIIEKQQSEINLNKQRQESQEKIQQTHQEIAQSKDNLNKKHAESKLNTYNKYIPFLTDPNAVNADTEADFLKALPDALKVQLIKEVAKLDSDYDSELKKLDAPAEKLKEESVKTQSEAIKKEFEKINAQDLSIPVVKDMVDLVVQDLTANNQPLNYEVLTDYKNNIKKIFDEGYKAGQLAKANEAQTGRMQSTIDGSTGKVYTAEKPPTIEEIRNMTKEEYSKVDEIVTQAMSKGYYNKK